MIANAASVRADLAVIVDSPRHASNLPTVFYGSRGLAGAEITIYGATGDLHSGNYGNFVPDPAMALTKLLASMKDDRGNVVIKNFYDGVVPLTAERAPGHRRDSERRSEAARAVRRRAVRASRQPHRAAAQPADVERRRSVVRHGRPGSAQCDFGERDRTRRDPTRERPRSRRRRTSAWSRTFASRAITSSRRRRTWRRGGSIRRLRASRRRAAGFRSARDRWTIRARRWPPTRFASLDQRLVQMPTIGGSLPFSTFASALSMPTIGLAVVNFDNNQHAVNENLRVGHLWEAIDIFAALITMTTLNPASASAESDQCLLDHVDRLPVLVERQMFVRRVIERAVTRPVRDDRALPHWPDDVHVARAGLQDEAEFLRRLDRAQAGEKTSDERIVAIAAPRFLVTAKLQTEFRPAGLLACWPAGLPAQAPS